MGVPLVIEEFEILVGVPLRVSPWPQASSPRKARLRGLGAHPLQQRGAPGALDFRSRGVAPSQRNLSGMPLRGDKKQRNVTAFPLVCNWY